MSDPPRDRLSYTIHFFGDLLGRVMRGQAGEATFLLEERVRALAKEIRASSGPNRPGHDGSLDGRELGDPASGTLCPSTTRSFAGARSEGQESARSRPQPQGVQWTRPAALDGSARRPRRERRARDLARSEHAGMLLGSMAPGDLGTSLGVTAPSEARCSPRIHLGLLVPRTAGRRHRNATLR
jgi:hypothetical protein